MSLPALSPERGREQPLVGGLALFSGQLEACVLHRFQDLLGSGSVGPLRLQAGVDEGGLPGGCDQALLVEGVGADDAGPGVVRAVSPVVAADAREAVDLVEDVVAVGVGD